MFLWIKTQESEGFQGGALDNESSDNDKALKSEKQKSSLSSDEQTSSSDNLFKKHLYLPHFLK